MSCSEPRYYKKQILFNFILNITRSGRELFDHPLVFVDDIYIYIRESHLWGLGMLGSVEFLAFSLTFVIILWPLMKH